MKLGDLVSKDVLSEFGLKRRTEEEMPYVSDLRNGMAVTIDLRVQSKRMQETRAGDPFLLLTLYDRTGAIRAIDWNDAVASDRVVEIGRVVRVRGRVTKYEERLQINVDKNAGISVVPDDKIQPERFISATRKNVPDLFERLLSFIACIDNDYLKELLTSIFTKDKGFVERFILSPAASRIHHAYKGGLLEHTVAVAELCEFIGLKYGDSVDKDILITGALLHDIGKVFEYMIGASGIDHSRRGELEGHISIGVEFVSDYASRVSNFPKELLMEIKHLILSHHGEMEWGSPILPKTTEAIVLHMSDNLDSKIAQFREIETREHSGTDYEWSNYDRYLNRRILMKNREDS